MRLVFMGTPDFAWACLETLHTEGFDIVGVYTKVDTPKNRGMKLLPSPVKAYAESVGLPVYQPQSFREEQTVQQLRELKPDLLVVVAYGKILPQAVLDIPTHGAINMHGSILPELRGSAPVQRSILNHCDEAGVTAMYLSAGMDEGYHRDPEDRHPAAGDLGGAHGPPGQDRCAALRRYRPRHRKWDREAHPAGSFPRDLRSHAP